MSYSSTAYSGILTPPTTIIANAIGASTVLTGDITSVYNDTVTGTYINSYTVPKGVWLVSGSVNLGNTGVAALTTGNVNLYINGVIKQYASIYTNTPLDNFSGSLNYVFKSDGTASLFISATVDTTGTWSFLIADSIEITRIA